MTHSNYESLPTVSLGEIGGKKRSRLAWFRAHVVRIKTLAILLSLLLFTAVFYSNQHVELKLSSQPILKSSFAKNTVSFQLDTLIVASQKENEYENLLNLNSVAPEDNYFSINTHFNDKQVIVPDMTDKSTILNLARMAQNAYVRNPHTGDWENITNSDSHDGFGWEDDYIRGHVFKNDDSKLIIISIKGTSSTGLPGTGSEKDTIENDKFNDNLLFSCCCARVTYLWTPVCDCYLDSFTCDEICLEKNLRDNSHYFKSSIQIYKTVANRYPDYTIWTVGHSLGGALSSLIARTYGLVGIAFESPGELLASQRLHLPLPDDASFDTIWHVGNNADPIYMGTCNGASSTCNLAGYAMESRCHTGWEITYDTVKELNWGVDIRRHRIKTVIYDVISKLEVPEAKFTGNGKGENPCIECYDWEFVRGKPSLSTSTVPTSSTTSTKTQRSTTTLTTTLSSSCVGRNFVGWCTSYTTF